MSECVGKGREEESDSLDFCGERLSLERCTTLIIPVTLNGSSEIRAEFPK